MYKNSAGPCTNMQRVAGVRLGPDSNNNGMEEGEQMLSFNSQSFQLFNVFRSLSLSPFSLYISKFPFYIQRHYRKAFNSSHNVLCIWILKEEMETFFAAAFTPPAKEGAQEKKEKEKKFLLLYCSFDMILIKELLVLELKFGNIIQNQIIN